MVTIIIMFVKPWRGLIPVSPFGLLKTEAQHTRLQDVSPLPKLGRTHRTLHLLNVASLIELSRIVHLGREAPTISKPADPHSNRHRGREVLLSCVWLAPQRQKSDPIYTFNTNACCRQANAPEKGVDVLHSQRCHASGVFCARHAGLDS